jgi:L-cysteine:1D-myo-inositol 2-amino-2-deoxy-alpha-D-glucopyranoside ligase
MMRIYNTQTKQLEPFQALGRRVGIYTCGITPYDTTHLGHAFTYAVSDMLIRYLEWLGFPVTYVQNVTDIDDDILKKAAEVGENWRALGDRWTAHFIQDMIQLNMRSPDYFPRATSVIPEIQETVQRLVDRGVAYVREGSVYFDTHAWEEFGKLSGLDTQEMLPIANERGNRPDDPNKRSPLDFVLWQAQSPGEPAWDSPWGSGRPGWHIECSTMSTRFLDGGVDIHLGGSDLMFPHHECEIAQVEPLGESGSFVRYWMHTAMVRYQGEKMSKSLGNLVMVRDLLQDYSADAIRIYLAKHHYRDSWEYVAEKLENAARLACKYRTALDLPNGSGNALDPGPWQSTFRKAMDNDLDTVGALQAVTDLADEILRPEDRKDVRQAQETLEDMGNVLGLRRAVTQPDAEVQAGWDRHLQNFTMHVENA